MVSRARSRLAAMFNADLSKDTFPDIKPIAVIDIGSNSVRLVVFDGLQRAPQALFNEKVMCGLGKALTLTGRMSDDAMESACQTLRRYAAVIDDMQCHAVRAVATAAVRDADNGAQFVARVKAETGLEVQVLDGSDEAYYSALGVISGIPSADGIVGDLGGGSLELVRIAEGEMHERVTLPIGPVRLLGDPSSDLRKRRKAIDRALKSVEWLKSYPGLPLYIVGGSWRALARIHIQRARYPLGILHQYTMQPDDVSAVYRLVRRIRPEKLSRFQKVPQRRIEALPTAARILDRTVALTGASEVVVSALGLREGILYEQLDDALRARDPLLEACRQISKRYNRFGDQSAALMNWLNPVFKYGQERPEMQRLRQAVCLMSDISWRGHPDFRAESAIYASLFGWFVGIDAPGRAAMGLALFTKYGARPTDDLGALAGSLLNKSDTAWALQLGTALRLAHRLAGGTPRALEQTSLQISSDGIGLRLGSTNAGYFGDVVARRLNDLAKALELPSLGML
ncbi:MAG: exopolyphosphatase [Pseudomonadota bacterium]